ncbi:LPXTG cell wall anchor domain-containing protein [Enterococcus sp. CWB-B31]|uniref:LPXTG cell wall anchor domain-containing protein n=1 Tax=Enterococcus sp. CWB-B31 TaxID=2885159 RepID=UPI001E2A76B3|nr:LPXTG cell wall anchor domain-containing protein [Enterococcus sp. CWB-B31]MCB5953910.1 LPXTG cell wall anchor domain-containing protein [Enterococcus sp. CWB-B31]
MNIRKAFLLSLALFLVGIAGFSPTALATMGAGGQVNSKGQITFYEGTIESSTTEPSTTESSLPESSTAEPTQTSSSRAATATKPQGGGTLPSTGEIVQKYSLMGAGLIAALIAFLLFRRRKKEEL